MVSRLFAGAGNQILGRRMTPHSQGRQEQDPAEFLVSEAAQTLAPDGGSRSAGVLGGSGVTILAAPSEVFPVTWVRIRLQVPTPSPGADVSSSQSGLDAPGHVRMVAGGSTMTRTYYPYIASLVMMS